MSSQSLHTPPSPSQAPCALPTPRPSTGTMCSACNRTLPKKEFSKNQLSKAAKRCKKCIAGSQVHCLPSLALSPPPNPHPYAYPCPYWALSSPLSLCVHSLPSLALSPPVCVCAFGFTCGSGCVCATENERLGVQNATTPVPAQPSEQQRPKENRPKPAEPPNEYLCPITCDLMEDPVLAADGHSYERSAIQVGSRRGSFAVHEAC